MKKITYFRPLGLYDYKAYIVIESFAKTLLRDIRWPNGIICPRCNQSKKIWKSGEDYLCRECSYHFSITSGTIFAKSHLTISQWIIAIGLFKIGVNSLWSQWAIGCHYRSACRVLHLIRQTALNDPLIAILAGEIEVDEAYYGGKRKGRRGRNAKGKTTVIIPDVEEKMIKKAILKHVKQDSTVYSDGFRNYNNLDSKDYQHLPFDHSVFFTKTKVIHTQDI